MSFFNTGCIEDKCAGLICYNEGVCVEGTCACMQGYEGDQCTTKWYEKFEGEWQATEKDKKGNVLNSYKINVIPTESPDTFLLLNIASYIDTVKCSRSTFLSFKIFDKGLTDTTALQGGDAQISENLSTVSGVYNTVKYDQTTTVLFTWAR